MDGSRRQVPMRNTIANLFCALGGVGQTVKKSSGNRGPLTDEGGFQVTRVTEAHRKTQGARLASLRR